MLLSGLLLAIAALTIIMLTVVVPSWKKIPQPSPTRTHSCTRNLDCPQDMTCDGQYCTKPPPQHKFPWGWIGLVGGATLLSLFLGSAAVLSRAQDDMKGELTKSLLIRSVVLVFGLALVIGICYMVYKLHYTRTCPGKPRDECPTGYTPVCDGATNFTWACSQTGSACGNYPPKCAYGPAECDPSTLVWRCPDATKCPGKPSSFNCPATISGVPHQPRCSAETKFEWVCDPYCSKKPPSTVQSCPSGQHPGCHIDTKYRWQCLDASSDVCGTTSHPSCSGALCIDTDSGWDWVCPGDMTKADVQRYKNIDCIDMADGDAAGASPSPINVCFTDSSKNSAIAPLVGQKCTAQDASSSIGKDLDNAVNNPRGNIYGGKVYKYDTDKRLYYQPDPNRQTQCIMSLDTANCSRPPTVQSDEPCCQNGGVFTQDKPGISITGSCTCAKTYVGNACQYSRETTCNGHGDPNPDSGVCKCDPTYLNAAQNVWFVESGMNPVIRVGVAQCKVKDTDTCYSQHPGTTRGYCPDGDPQIYTAQCDTLPDPVGTWDGEDVPRGWQSIDYSRAYDDSGACDN